MTPVPSTAGGGRKKRRRKRATSTCEQEDSDEALQDAIEDVGEAHDDELINSMLGNPMLVRILEAVKRKEAQENGMGASQDRRRPKDKSSVAV